MAENLLLFGPKRLAPFAKNLENEFATLGLNAKCASSPRTDCINVLLLDPKTSPEELYKDLPWLKEQFEYSSLKGFRLLPFLVFDSQKENVEELDDQPIAEVLEEVLSGEFKPFGYDKAKKNPMEEFLSVLEEYEE